jgi:hypothetical protein
LLHCESHTFGQLDLDAYCSSRRGIHSEETNLSPFKQNLNDLDWEKVLHYIHTYILIENNWFCFCFSKSKAVQLLWKKTVREVLGSFKF